jgi:hypothetical protein
MSRKLLQWVIRVILVILSVVGCGGPPAAAPVSEAPVATTTPVPSMATLTPVPLTVTPTPAPPTATLTPVPSTATPTSVPPTAGGEVEGKLSVADVKVTLCSITTETGLPGQPTECIGDFEKSVMTDTTGHFTFSAIPSGVYYIFFDIPEALKDAVLHLCQDGEFRRRDYLQGGGAREFCLSGPEAEKVFGPTVAVEAGKTTIYSPHSPAP